MKPKLSFVIACLLLVGCAETRHDLGGSAENDGNVLTGGPITGVTLNELPVAVRGALLHHAPDAEIADIDKTMRAGQEVYEISFVNPGRNPKLYITVAGNLISNPELPR
jgi:hypothetical protein